MSLPSSAPSHDPSQPVDWDREAASARDNQTVVGQGIDAVSQDLDKTILSQSLAGDFSAPSSDSAEQTRLEPPTATDFTSPNTRGPHPDAGPPVSRKPAGTGTGERYRLLENFAHGGLGNIWRAEDTAIRREVAFKELLPKALRNRVTVERFIEEAQISGQLEHPGIIPIYDVGFRENGTPYYTMKLLRGGSMDEAINALHALPRGSSERQLAFSRLLRQFIAICQAVAFAHEKGVLHRDLKPQNVMLGEYGETLVLDWGLAKLVDLIGEQMVSSDRSERTTPESEPEPDANELADDAQSDVATLLTNVPDRSASAAEFADHAPASFSGMEFTHTHMPGEAVGAAPVESKSAATRIGSKTQNAATSTATGQRPVQTGMRSAGSETLMGQVMGTPAYMSPEQALGQIDELDSRADIYSLGGILYKILTNKQPVGKGKIQVVLQKVIAGEISPPRTIDPTIPKPLEAISLKAMSKDKAGRYPKALELAADVEAWLADQPVVAYPDPWLTRVKRWTKRNRTLVVSSSATLLALIIGAGAWQWSIKLRIDRAENEARTKLSEARSLAEKLKFDEAEKRLTTALDQELVQSEPRLVFIRQEIQNEIARVLHSQAAVERERVAKIRNEADLDLAKVQQLIHDKQDFSQAKLILTRVTQKLALEPSFSELARAAQTQLQAVDLFESFVKAVEQTRIYGGNISGDESLDDIRESKTQALSALEIFQVDFDQPDKANPQLRSLGDKAIAKWREGLQEVLVTLGYLETKLAIHDDKAALLMAARRSLDHVLKAERLGFSSQPMWYLRSDLHTLLGEDDEAQQARRSAEMLTPKTRLDHYLLGEFARTHGKYQEALSHFENALDADSNDFWSFNMLGLCHYQLGEYAAAIPSYTACIARRPDFIWPYLTRGVAYGRLEQFPKAHRDLAKSLELDPQSYHAYLNRGAVYVLEENYEAAQADFEKASQLKPDQAAPYINLAAAGLEKANQMLKASNKPTAAVLAAAEYQRARVALTSALRLFPQQASIYSFRGKILLSLNEANAALADFEKATQLEEPSAERRADNLKQMGLLHHRARQWSEAVAAFDRSLAENANDKQVICRRAEALQYLGRSEDAVKGFNTFLQKPGPVPEDCSLAEVYRFRAMAFTNLKRHRDAINDYTLSLQHEPSPGMLSLRGWAYLLEASTLAKADFEEAVQLNPRNPDNHHGLANALVRLGDHAGAVAQIEKSFEITKTVIEQNGPKAWTLLYNPATVYAQASSKVLADSKLDQERRTELAQQYSQRAVELLIATHQLAGPQFQSKLWEYVLSDTDLDPIRKLPVFLAALKMMAPESAPKPDSK